MAAIIPTRHWRPTRGPFGQWLRDEVLRECRNHGLPQPVKVEPVAELSIPGSRSLRWMEFRRNLKEDRIRSGYGLRLEFKEPVLEPLALGYARKFDQLESGRDPRTGRRIMNRSDSEAPGPLSIPGDLPGGPVEPASLTGHRLSARGEPWQPPQNL